MESFPSLDHEAGNYAMKRQAVVIVFLQFFARHFVSEFLGPFRKAYEIGHRLGRFLLQQANDNIALRSLEYRVRSSRSSHGSPRDHRTLGPANRATSHPAAACLLQFSCAV
jgi:hypothetical protein